MNADKSATESALKAAITEKFVSSRGPLNRLKARRLGWDYVSGHPPTLEFYYEAGDPHSALSMQWLRQNQERLRCPIRIRVVGEPEGGNYPESDKQRQFALDDARRIAAALNLASECVFSSSSQIVSATKRFTGNAWLIPEEQDLNRFLEREQQLSTVIFAKDQSALDNLMGNQKSVDQERAKKHLTNHSQRRDRLGHYLPAMWQFNGEWFWGLDRMHHLEQRLRSLNLLEGNSPLIKLDPAQAKLPEFSSLPPLEFFFSFRSPYSYLAAQEIQEFAKSAAMPIQVRPVLPMAMRGMKISLGKMLYIPRDTYREAQYLGLPFGRASDPVGQPTERCITAFSTIDDEQKKIDFVAEASRAIWTEAVRVGTDAGLQRVCAAANVDWQSVKTCVDQGMHLELAETNRQALFDAGLWGVPSFRLGDFATWGRDRFWMIEEIIRRSTDA